MLLGRLSKPLSPSPSSTVCWLLSTKNCQFFSSVHSSSSPSSIRSTWQYLPSRSVTLLKIVCCQQVSSKIVDHPFLRFFDVFFSNLLSLILLERPSKPLNPSPNPLAAGYCPQKGVKFFLSESSVYMSFFNLINLAIYCPKYTSCPCTTSTSPTSVFNTHVYHNNTPRIYFSMVIVRN